MHGARGESGRSFPRVRPTARSLATVPEAGLIDPEMPLSQSDRDALIERVEQRVRTRGLDRAAVTAAVDQVLCRLALPDESSPSGQVLVALSAESMPDLASRFRLALHGAGVAVGDVGTATVGRHTVLAMRAPGDQVQTVATLARKSGARFRVVGAAGSGGEWS